MPSPKSRPAKVSDANAANAAVSELTPAEALQDLVEATFAMKARLADVRNKPMLPATRMELSVLCGIVAAIADLILQAVTETKKEPTSAPEKIRQRRGKVAKHRDGDSGRQADEAGGRNRVQRAAQGAEKVEA